MYKSATFFFALCLSGLCQGGNLVYVPINPAFGGNPLNGNFLLNEAQSQDAHTDPNALSASALRSQQTPLQQFNESLQRTILNRIASAVTGGIVDSNGNLIPGTVETTDFTISIIQVSAGVLQVTTTDKATGQSTSFEVSN